jgi:hypothetical protein
MVNLPLKKLVNNCGFVLSQQEKTDCTVIVNSVSVIL